MPSLQDARADVHRAFDRARELADDSDGDSFFDFERKLWTALLALGRALVVLFLARRARRPRAADYEHDRRRYRLDGERTTPLGTRFGKVEFTRPVGRRVHKRDAAVDLPVDRELGLCTGFSLGVLAAMTRFCAQMAFASARATFASTYEWTPSPRATLRMVDSVGTEARTFLEQGPAPDDDGEILVLQVDGGGAPMISAREHARRRRARTKAKRGVPRRHQRRQRRKEHPRVRRTKGKKSKNAKLAVVGVIYTLRRTAKGMEGPINKRIVATFESHEALFIWLHREAVKRGYGQKRTLFIADGLDHIWRLCERYFPDAEPCVDWYHVIEKIWAAGECLHREGSKELAAWVALQAGRLRKGDVHGVIMSLEQHQAKIAKTGPGTKGKRNRLGKTLKYLRDNLHRMPYKRWRDDDLDIASGAVEGAVRNLVRVRLDGPGMRWGRERAERVLHLRCVLINGQWDEFTQHLGQQPVLRLAAQPAAAVTHDAKAKAAA
jgi:hypothetical protein